jgi:glyoxylase-like metal-dependent hydrolase (beta-lactamase superfamily II)
MNSSMLYLKQLLSGRDYAIVNPIAGQMANFAYLVGDKDKGECYVVDPAWDPRGLIQIAEEDGMKVVGCIATHCHPDHVGGTMMGFPIQGVAELVEQANVKVWVHEDDAAELRRGTGLKPEDLCIVRGGDTLPVGDQVFEFIHTPGHTPGGMCLLVGNGVITGDTLFVGACGRVDLPGADPKKMFESLTVTLRALPDDLVVYPGHDYGRTQKSTIGAEKRSNPFMQPDGYSDGSILE